MEERKSHTFLEGQSNYIHGFFAHNYQRVIFRRLGEMLGLHVRIKLEGAAFKHQFLKFGCNVGLLVDQIIKYMGPVKEVREAINISL